jgi:hypothetical protein
MVNDEMLGFYFWQNESIETWTSISDTMSIFMLMFKQQWYGFQEHYMVYVGNVLYVYIFVIISLGWLCAEKRFLLLLLLLYL